MNKQIRCVVPFPDKQAAGRRFQAPNRIVCGLLALELTASLALCSDVHLINPSSEPMGVPAVASARALGDVKDGTYAVSGSNGPLSADVFGGRVYLFAPLKAMSAAKLGFDGKASSAKLLCVAADPGKPVEVETEAGIYRIGTDSIEIESKGRKIRFSSASFKPEVVFKGANMVVVAGADKTGKQQIEIYRSGIARFTGFKGFAFTADEPLLSSQARKLELGVAKTSNGQPLTFAEDWWRIAGKDKTLGTGVFPACGTTAKGKDNAIAFDGGSPSVWVAPVSSDREAWSARAQTQPALIASGEENGAFHSEVELAGKSAKLTIIDRNANHLPDMDGDLWLWGDDAKPVLALAFSQSPDKDSGKRLCIFKTGAADLSKSVLDENPADASKPAPEGKSLLKPEVIVEDWNKDGIFLHGGLVFGGFLGADRYSKDGVKWSQAWDLDGDTFCDVFEDAPGHYLFNFKQEMISQFGLELDPLAATAAIRQIKGYGIQEHCSIFSKSCDPSGRMFKGAVQAFEEHFFADIKPEENPAVWKNGAAFFYYVIGGGDVNRMTMGRLGGSKALRDWNIELDPVPPANSEADWKVVTLKDKAGHELKLNTISVPDGWNGAKADVKQYYQGWYDTVDGKYKTNSLYACFSPPGAICPSSEGMYGGSLTTQERIEVDEKGGTFTLYYSPLMGALHLKGADFGAYAIPAGTPDFFLDINRYYHREAHTGAQRFVGAQPTVTWHQREAKRLIGPVFLGYSDEDGDGFFDRYIYDMDNDGIYDRILSYDAKAGVVSLTDKNFTATWPQRIAFEEVKYVPEKYDQISALYQKGTGQPPLVASMSIGSSGTPVNLITSPFYKEVIPPFFDTFGKEWQTVVASDSYHCGTLDPWLDFGPDGVTRIGSMFAKRGIVQKTLDAKWTDHSLKGVDVLLIPYLSRTPSADEIKALKRWIENGGVCILSTIEDNASWMRFAAVGKEMGFKPSEEFLSKRTPINMWKGLGGIGPQAKASETRMPAPWNEVKHFEDPMKAGLLEGFDYLSFVGFPLEDLREGLKPVLGYDGKILMALAEIGKGRLLVSGVDLWTNRYIWHHEFFEGGSKNDRLVDRLVGLATAGLPVLSVSEMNYSPEKITIKVAGKGGPLKFSRRYDALSTDLACIGNRAELAKKKFALARASVNGAPVAILEIGTLEEIQLPPGESTVEISYEEIKP